MGYKRIVHRDLPLPFLVIITMAAIAVFVQIDRMQRKSADIRTKAYQQTRTGVRVEAEEMALSGSVVKDPTGTSVQFVSPPAGEIVPVSSDTCPPSGTPVGGTTMIDVDLNLGANYHFWVQMSGKGDGANTIWLQLDNLFCAKVGDLAGMPKDSWIWVDYQNGDVNSKIPFPIIGTGHHIVKLIGNGSEPGVSVDRILMVVDATCVPTGNGDACVGLQSTPTPTPIPTPNPTITLAPTTAQAVPGKKNAVTDGPTILTTQFPDGFVGTAYSATIEVSDPTPSDTLSLSSSGLPDGISLSGCQIVAGFGGTMMTCTLSGTPTIRGNFRPKFTVVDKSGASASKTINLRISR